MRALYRVTEMYLFIALYTSINRIHHFSICQKFYVFSYTLINSWTFCVSGNRVEVACSIFSCISLLEIVWHMHISLSSVCKWRRRAAWSWCVGVSETRTDLGRSLRLSRCAIPQRRVEDTNPLSHRARNAD